MPASAESIERISSRSVLCPWKTQTLLRNWGICVLKSLGRLIDDRYERAPSMVTRRSWKSDIEDKRIKLNLITARFSHCTAHERPRWRLEKRLRRCFKPWVGESETLATSETAAPGTWLFRLSRQGAGHVFGSYSRMRTGATDRHQHLGPAERALGCFYFPR